jgi:hypothetical protein
MTEKTPRERLEEERAKPISEQPGPVAAAPDPRPMYEDQDLARRLSFVLDREGVDVGPDSVVINEKFSGPGEPRRFVVVIKDHEHGGEYHLSPHVTASELAAWINGLDSGFRNEITNKSNDAVGGGSE